MKQQWQRIELKIDALSLRERAMAFAIAALVLIALINTLVLDPLLAQQKQFSQQVRLDQQQVAAIQAEIQAKVKAHEIDPDAVNRAKLEHLKEQLAKLRTDLTSMQKGLVSPDKMAALLEDLLKRNGKLHLTSLKTLPVTLLNGPTASELAVKPVAENIAPQSMMRDHPTSDAVYKHGVEIVVQGGYLDLMTYLAQLEAMPWQLFWAQANLSVDEYPKTSLTLTLFTLSLDRKWLNI